MSPQDTLEKASLPAHAMKETYRLVSQSFLYTHRAPASLLIKGPKGGWGNFPKEYFRKSSEI